MSVCMPIHVCARAYMHVSVHTKKVKEGADIYIYIYIYIYTYIYTHTYVYLHTYTQMKLEFLDRRYREDSHIHTYACMYVETQCVWNLNFG
jgi:hypothetical protein